MTQVSPTAASTIARQSLRRRSVLRVTWRLTVAVALTIIFLFPVYWMFAVSLKTPEEIFASPPIWYPHDLQFGNFAVLFKEGDALSVLNSLVIAGISTAITMILGTFCAYSIVRFKTGGDNLAIWIISQRMLPPAAIVRPRTPHSE